MSWNFLDFERKSKRLFQLFINQKQIIIFFFSVEVFYHVKSIILVKISDKQEGILWWWRKRQKAFQTEYKSWRLLKQSPKNLKYIHMNFENWISHFWSSLSFKKWKYSSTYMYDIANVLKPRALRKNERKIKRS